jgi:hypothetical protein
MTQSAHALTPPKNDSKSGATVIGTLPYSKTENTKGATQSSTDPKCAYQTGGISLDDTVWFTFTASSSERYEILTSAADSDAVALIKGSKMVHCSTSVSGKASIFYQASAGAKYYIMVDLPSWGKFNLSVSLPGAPANDDFINAAPVSMPMAATFDATNATAETGEPADCGLGVSRTVWYSITPVSSGTIYLEAQPTAFMSVYTGTDLASLTEVTCTSYTPDYTELSFSATSAQTYYVQIAPSNFGPDLLHVGEGTNPIASFTYSQVVPYSKSHVGFWDTSYDPLHSSSTASWDFGDGSQGSGWFVQHTYATSGVYSVKLTETTGDSRTASITQDINVVVK